MIDMELMRLIGVFLLFATLLFQHGRWNHWKAKCEQMDLRLRREVDAREEWQAMYMDASRGR